MWRELSQASGEVSAYLREKRCPHSSHYFRGHFAFLQVHANQTGRALESYNRPKNLLSFSEQDE